MFDGCFLNNDINTKCKQYEEHTIDRSLAGQHHNYQLKPCVRILQVAEHRLHLVGIGCILTEAWLTHDGHASVR